MSKDTKPAPAKAVSEKTPVVTATPITEKVEGTTKATIKKLDAKSAGFSVYIGPSIPGVIQSGHIYSGSRAEALKAIAPIVEKRPLVASLLVDGNTLAADRIKVKTPGNLLLVNYKKLASGETK